MLRSSRTPERGAVYVEALATIPVFIMLMFGSDYLLKAYEREFTVLRKVRELVAAPDQPGPCSWGDMWTTSGRAQCRGKSLVDMETCAEHDEQYTWTPPPAANSLSSPEGVLWPAAPAGKPGVYGEPDLHNVVHGFSHYRTPTTYHGLQLPLAGTDSSSICSPPHLGDDLDRYTLGERRLFPRLPIATFMNVIGTCTDGQPAYPDTCIGSLPWSANVYAQGYEGGLADGTSPTAAVESDDTSLPWK